MNRFYKEISFFLVLIGIIIAFLPQISNYIFTRETDRVIKNYVNNISNMEFEEIWNEAIEWNKYVYNANNVQISKKELKKYKQQLNINGIMGYISIPSINVQLPIYHGTSNKALSKGVGHLEKSSLPVGGKGTHCVLTGHTGLTIAEMFNNIKKLKNKDKFYLTVAGHMLTYEIYNIKTVLPSEVEVLKAIYGKDYCSLVTCTPYGINTHRLIVMGERIGEENYQTSYYINNKKDIQMLIIVLSLLLSILIVWRIYAKKNKSKKRAL